MDKVTDGLKHDGGKPRLDLVPPEIIEAVGAVMTHGAEKYGEGSYRNVEPKRYRAALMRHICQWLRDPHGIDEDSGLPHLYHIACNVAFLLEIDNKRDVINEEEHGRWPVKPLQWKQIYDRADCLCASQRDCSYATEMDRRMSHEAD